MYSSAKLTALDTPCFWALLCPEQFRFVYLPDSLQVNIGDEERPIRSLLYRKSLLEFIHPDEQCIAQADLDRFLRFRTLAGSITRCRLLSFQNIGSQQNGSLATPFIPAKNDQTTKLTSSAATVPDIDESSCSNEWDVVDIVMYIATESIILAFFHRTGHDDTETSSRCGDYSLTNHEIRIMLDILEEREQITRSSPAPENLRLFQIHASSTGKFIASWPPGNTSNDSAEIQQREKLDDMLRETKSVMQKEIIMLNSMNSSDEKLHKVACRHPFRSSSLIHLADGTYRIEHIIIPYGPITFGAFQITMVATASSTCSGQGQHSKTTYRHYVHYNVPETTGTSDTSSADLTVPFIGLVQTDAKSNYNRSSSSSKQPGTSLVAVQQRSHHISGSSSITMVHGVNNRMDSQLYMSVNQLLCPPTCESVDLRENRPHKLSPRYNYSPFPRSIEVRICAKCHTRTSPEWRKGPSGNKTLCNACGLRFSRLVAKQRRMSSHQRH
ncbi:hypothetical protein BJV82DRAFT_604628 [Fennellomyces sp. T-0311]|nr:hypothetical protein BJV82DRAFT_604628 [Fennellomyces sp. T-0311]